MTQWLRNSTRAAIYVRDQPPGQKSPACVYCGRAVRIGEQPGPSDASQSAAVIDHVIPGAGNARTNLVTACWSCNRDKGERTPDEWEMDRLERGLDPVPRWRSRRPEPRDANGLPLSLQERADAAIARDVCRTSQKKCREQLQEMEWNRQAAAYAARRARTIRARSRGFA